MIHGGQHRLVLCLIIALLWTNSARGQAGELVESTLIVWRGSGPPIPSIYSCIRELEGHPYAEDQTRKCMERIMNSGAYYFTSYDVKRRPVSKKSTSIELDIYLTSPDR